MCLRWKILSVLLITSLAPIVVVMLLGHRGAKHTAQELANGTREALMLMMMEDLEYDVADVSMALENEVNSLEFMASTLAREVSINYKVQKLPPNVSVRTLDDFANPATAPDDLAVGKYFHSLLGAGPPTPLRVSVTTPVFHVVGDEARAARLREASMGLYNLPLMQSIFSDYNKPIHHLFLAFENGVYVGYPGHGGIPPEWDHRRQEWYASTMEANATTWSAPVVDPATKQPTFSVSSPIIGAGGTPIGLAGLSLQVVDALRGLEYQPKESAPQHNRSRAITQATHIFYAFISPHPTTGEDSVRLIGMDIEGQPTMKWLQAHKEPLYAPLLSAMQANRTGQILADYNDVPCICAFSPLETNHALLFILPQASIEAIPNRAATSIAGFLGQQRLYIGLFGLVVVGASILMAILLAKKLTLPMLEVVGAAEKFSQGDFKVRLSTRTGDERDTLINAFNEMGPRLEDHLKIRKALELAEEVQQSLLPREMPCLPGYDIAGRILYCDETGGDYLDAFTMNHDEGERVAVVVGDVTGHGVPSALLMATARALLRGYSSVGNIPGGLAGRITLANRLLCQDVRDSGRFMTLFFMELDQQRDIIHWVRAGHDPALLYNPVTQSFQELLGEGLLLGVVEDFEYAAFSQAVEIPGSIIIIGTDGIWEAMDDSGAQFGKERMLECIQQNAHKSATEIVQAVLDAVHAFAPTPQDDVTLVVIKKREDDVA